MTTRNLDHLFRPKSIALIGASDRAGSVGALVMRNLLAGGYTGRIYPVNPGRSMVAQRTAYPDIASLPDAPDLAVIATPPRSIPALIRALGERGTRAAVVLTAGLSTERLEDGRTITQAMQDEARPYLLRIVGPNCVGMLVPDLGINASFAHIAAVPGSLAFVSQSGGLTTAVLDWARSRGIGFSHFVSLGDSADVDFGDMLDYLASDPHTRAILLYIESVRDTRKFMSAARAAARNKPVIVVKAGRAPEGARAAASHTGALAGADDVYDAAIRRAGMLRVDTVLELFEAVETLARARTPYTDQLAILTNGGGPGVMATDALGENGVRLAELSPGLVKHLDTFLPSTWSHGNPVDIIGDAPIERYVEALKPLLEESSVGAVLFIHVPTAIVPAVDIARAVAPIARGGRVLSCWLGGDSVEPARRIFQDAGIPTYDTPEEAVAAFGTLIQYRRNQQSLMETPDSVPRDFSPDLPAVRLIVDAALAEGRGWLSEPEAKRVLEAYGLTVARTIVAHTVDEAVAAAQELGFPVVIKILSPQVLHKSDIGGVVLDLKNASEVAGAAERMGRRLHELHPAAELQGYAVQQMIQRNDAHELIIGMTVDPSFGPVILFGHGGVAVEVIADRAVALPPLNMALARDLIRRTRVFRLLRGYRDRPPADLGRVQLALVQVSQLIIDVPEIVELDVNPLLADEQGVVALDARIRVAPATKRGADRLAIRPYPSELEEKVLIDGREILLRPIRPEDEPQHAAFIARVSPEDLAARFFHAVRSLPHAELARLTQIDYDREMAFIAIAGLPDAPETLGVVRAINDPDETRAEYGILVRSDVQGQGLGLLLMQRIIHYCRSRGISWLEGEVLMSNQKMLAMARALGFAVQASAEPSIAHVRLDLHQPDAAIPGR